MFSIKFYCDEIVGYSHLNLDGSICLHPKPEENLKVKIRSEFNLLKIWIKDYYIEQKSDPHYGYLLINSTVHACMMFEERISVLDKNSHGEFQYIDFYRRDIAKDLTYQQFIAINLGGRNLNWSEEIRNQENRFRGVWVYIENEPVKIRREPGMNWKDIEKHFSKENVLYLLGIANSLMEENKLIDPSIDYFFMMLGYRIPGDRGDEVHWELIKINYSSIPFSFKGGSNEEEIEFCDAPIQWAKTVNCSYERFFGRGQLHSEIADKNILVIGIGAIGSALSKHLVRGGSKKITLVDYDIVEAGNICRSEYDLHHINEYKAISLSKELRSISPHVSVNCIGEIDKTLPGAPNFYKIKSFLNDFDLIFDCSTDMELSYMFDRMEPKSRIVNLSVTDKAKDLVCVIGGYNVTDQKAIIFTKVSPITHPPNYYPGSGCQYPTFQASYTDINSLVSFAVRQINFGFIKENLQSFVISTSDEDALLKLSFHVY